MFFLFCFQGNKNGNRRTASIRSVGYSDLFVLSKDDLWDALTEYPDAKRALIEAGRNKLLKDNLLDEQAARKQDLVDETLDVKVERLETALDNCTTRLARLMADFSSTQLKLKQRITKLERRATSRAKSSCDADVDDVSDADDSRYDAGDMIVTSVADDEVEGDDVSEEKKDN